MTDLLKRLEQKLQERTESGNLRQLTALELPYDFVSNDYLGMARSEELANRIRYRYESLEILNKNGTGGSRLLSGNTKYAVALEKKLADLFRAEAALIFPSGYMANLALISTIAGKEDTILYDQLSHVCLKEGAWMSRADARPFRHNDIRDLELKLKQNHNHGDVFVLMETVYSMDGDIGPVEEIHRICRYYGAHLIIDEAHSTGVMGPHGSGYINEIDYHDKIFGRVYTFGKGMGVHGACVCGDKVLIDYLINFCRPFIFTTAVALHQLVAIEQAFDYLFDYPEVQTKLQDKIKLFKAELGNLDAALLKAKFPVSNTAIQPIIIPGNRRVKKITSALQAHGFDVRPILSPTVKSGTERIRISLHCHNTDEEIKKLASQIKILLLEN